MNDGPQSQKNESNSRSVDVSRRQYVLGVTPSVAGLGWLSSRQSTVDRTEIVTHVSETGPQLTKMVPTKWYKQKQVAERVKDTLFERYRGEGGILGVGLAPGERSIDGYRYFDVEVHVHDDRGTNAAVPDEVNGVAVRKRHRSPLEEGDSCNDSSGCYFDDYDPIRGGVALTRPDASTSATSTCRVERNGNEYMMCARHFVVDSSGRDSCSTNDPTGNEVGQNHDYYGTVTHHFPEYDAALTELDGSDGERDGFSSTIVDQWGSIVGHVSKDGIDDMIANDGSRTIHQRGTNHCEETGQVEWREDDYCSSIGREDLIASTVDFGNGDSGGPVYDEVFFENRYYVYIINIATNYLPDDESGKPTRCTWGFGSAAYAMNDTYGISFG